MIGSTSGCGIAPRTARHFVKSSLTFSMVGRSTSPHSSDRGLSRFSPCNLCSHPRLPIGLSWAVAVLAAPSSPSALHTTMFSPQGRVGEGCAPPLPPRQSLEQNDLR
eukprot:839755-Amphidinium_carterae.1